jgi:hypothetical protein
MACLDFYPNYSGRELPDRSGNGPTSEMSHAGAANKPTLMIQRVVERRSHSRIRRQPQRWLWLVGQFEHLAMGVSENKLLSETDLSATT